MYEDFKYVDFWEKEGGGAWRRVPLEGPNGIITHKAKLAKLSDVYTSVQLYQRQFHEEGELQICPIFFDLDGEDLEKTLEEAQKLSSFLDDVGVPYDQQRWNFSGKRGFHCVVNFRCYRSVPAVDAHEIVKKLALHTGELLQLKTLDDKVYSTRRVLRIPGTRHSGSGLYAIPLDTDRLNSTTSAEILEAAKTGEPAPEWRYVADDTVHDGAYSWVGCFCRSPRGGEASPEELTEERDRAEVHWWQRCARMREGYRERGTAPPRHPEPSHVLSRHRLP